MSRLFLVPGLVFAVFLSGCKSAQQGADRSLENVGNRFEDWCCSTRQTCEDWLEQHPTAKHVANVAAFVVLTAAVVALAVVVFYVWLRTQDDS